jgi:hypothetical protein
VRFAVKNTLALSFALLLNFIAPVLALSAGVPICTAPGARGVPGLIANQPGSAIVVWMDGRSSGYDVYVQRIDGSALPQWTSNGMPLTTNGAAVTPAYTVPDGAGGVIFAWSAWGSSGIDIYAQRIDASGTALWAAGGILINAQPYDQWVNDIMPDGAGGAIIAWADDKPNHDTISAQRVDASGTLLWPAAGVLVSGDALGGYNLNSASPLVVPDGAGGAIVVWNGNYLRAYGSDYQTESDAYAQRIDASGTKEWGVSGVLIGPFPGNQFPANVISDDAGGAIVTWETQNANDNGNTDIYTQRVSPTGTPVWDPSGVAVTTLTGNQYVTGVIPDGAGGAFMTWDGKSRNWLQRVSASGVLQYAGNGIMTSKYESYGAGSYLGNLVPDGAGGVIVAWADRRNIATDSDVYAQRFNGSGVPLWTSWGVPVSVEYSRQQFPHLVPDGSGGALIAWWDTRDDFSVHIFAQRVSANGVLTLPTTVGGTRTPSLVVSDAHPNPFAEQTSLDVVLPGTSPVTVEMFDVAGHRVRSTTVSPTGGGPVQVVIDGRDQNAGLLPSGVYFCRIHAGAQVVTKKLIIAR